MQKTFGPPRPPIDGSGQAGIDVVELSKREGILEERERMLAEKQQLIEEKLESLEKIRKDLISKLEKSSKMSSDEAQKILLENVEKDLASEISKKVREAEEQIKLQADEKSKGILAEAMLHGATDYIAEFTTSQVKLPDEEMKGRIIGKEGRNVRAFEAATGVDVLMDETPGVLIISSFDPVRREIAKKSLEKGFSETILDTGFKVLLKKGILSAFLKGLIDGGMQIPHGDKEIFPAEERISGQHISQYAQHLKQNKTAYEKIFSGYLKKNLNPETIQSEFIKVKEKILKNNNFFTVLGICYPKNREIYGFLPFGKKP